MKGRIKIPPCRKLMRALIERTPSCNGSRPPSRNRCALVKCAAIRGSGGKATAFERCAVTMLACKAVTPVW
jgi:hypothetical protein